MNDLERAFADLTLPARRVRDIVDEVAEYTGIPADEILGAKRDLITARARQFVMWKARKEGHTLTAIGNALGRDHTSINHGVAKIERLLSSNVVALRGRNVA